MVEWKRVTSLAEVESEGDVVFGNGYRLSVRAHQCFMGINTPDIAKLVVGGMHALLHRGTAQDRKRHQACVDIMQGNLERAVYGELLDVVPA